MAKKLFVGNLRFDTTREELEGLFSQVGPIGEIALPVERETGRPRGFAFIEFQNDEHADAAIEKFNGFEVRGRQLRVNAAEDRPPRKPGSFGGGAGRSFGGGRPGGGGESGGYGGGYSNDFGGGGDFGGDRFGGGGKSKGSRRNIRSKKRSL